MEGALEDLPLDRVGVLELVDQGDLPPSPHAGARVRPGVVEGVGQLAEQVVVAEHAQAALAALDLGEDVGGEPHPGGRGRVGCLGEGGPGLDRGAGVVDHGPTDLEGDVVGPRWRGQVGEAGEEEVVDDLVGQLLEVLDETGVGVGVAGDAEAAQDQLAELVDGGDRRCVEVGERGGQACQPQRSLGLVGVEEPGDHRVGGG